MHRRRFLLTSLAGVFATPLATRAQPAGRISRVGFMANGKRQTHEALPAALGLAIPTSLVLQAEQVQVFE